MNPKPIESVSKNGANGVKNSSIVDVLSTRRVNSAVTSLMGKYRLLKVGLLYFFATAAVAALIQLVVVPRYLADRDGGYGLLVNTDSISFHLAAKEAAEKITATGWSNWKSGHDSYGGTTVGITSAVYALTGVHTPLSMIPFNAAVHALSAVIIAILFIGLGVEFQVAVLSSLPFLIFPSSASWYAQIHRDGIVFLGFLVSMLGWFRLIQAQGDRFTRLSRYFFAAVLIFCGYFLSWFTRPYLILVYLFLGGLVLLVVLYASLRRSSGKWAGGKSWLPEIYFTLSVLAVQASCAHFFKASNFLQMPDIKLNQPIPFFQTDSKVSVESTTGAAARSQRDAYPVCPWEPSSVLPKRIEMAFFGIAKARNGFRNTNYRLDRTLDTDIDADVGFCNVADVIKYIPRALQVGLLAPFPVALISSKSSYAYGGTFRKIAAVEMIIAYMLFPFAIFFGVVCVRRRALWTLLTFTIGTILMETLAITNLGTLYRHRYGFFMPIISLGVAGLHLMIQRMRSAVPIFGRAHRA